MVVATSADLDAFDNLALGHPHSSGCTLREKHRYPRITGDLQEIPPVSAPNICPRLIRHGCKSF